MVKVFTCIDHDLHYPVGCASVVVAEDEPSARFLLDDALVERGLKPFSRSPYTLVELNTSEQRAVVLADGNY